MKNSSLTLYLEINNLNYIFFVVENNGPGNFKILYKSELPLKGIENNKIIDFEEVSRVIKKNIYIIEQKLSHTFKEIALILDNFEFTFVNLSGFKKLNGSQVLRENITYILNTLKVYVDEIEFKKKVLHIFNTKFYLDNKKIDNLPIGLFGDFYSHELSFTLINSNDYKNLKSIFEKCNLNIKKIFIKSFIEGANISENHKNIETFFQITIKEDKTTIFYFENNSLKYEQTFKFGSDIIIKDISKITSLKTDNIKEILSKIKLEQNISEDQLVEEKFFVDSSYRKIKKKLIYEIVHARIKEISELVLFKNVNLKYYNKISKVIFLKIENKIQDKSLNEIFKKVFSINSDLDINFLEPLSSESMMKTANNLVHFGWKKEAIPVLQVKKSLIVRFFDKLFS